MKTLILVGLSPLALLLFHALMVRVIVQINPKMSNQAVILLSIFLFNIPLLGMAWTITGPDLIALLYIITTVNCFAYCYFHLFNMTETARRIKVLTGIYTSKVKYVEDLAGYYDTEKALDLRLQRLEKLSQIR